MTDDKKLVEALRETAKHLDGISRFPYDDDPAKRIYSKKMTDAADAIEALQAEVDALKHDIERYVGINAELTTEIEALQAEQKKTVTQIFGEEQMAWEGRCKDLMKYISDLQAEVERLKASNEELRKKHTYIDHYGNIWMTSAKDVPNAAYEHGYADGWDEARAKMEVQDGQK